jgi:hypothetical protein
LKTYKTLGYKVGGALPDDYAQIDLHFAEVESVAIRAVTAFEEARGWTVESVECETRGFDLISRRSDASRSDVRFIEVKGRAAIGDIALSANEYKTALSLGDEYWLYVVFNCGSKPVVLPVQNPARLDWEALSKVDCYRIKADSLPVTEGHVIN